MLFLCSGRIVKIFIGINNVKGVIHYELHGIYVTHYMPAEVQIMLFATLLTAYI